MIIRSIMISLIAMSLFLKSSFAGFVEGSRTFDQLDDIAVIELSYALIPNNKAQSDELFQAFGMNFTPYPSNGNNRSDCLDRFFDLLLSQKLGDLIEVLNEIGLKTQATKLRSRFSAYEGDSIQNLLYNRPSHYTNQLKEMIMFRWEFIAAHLRLDLYGVLESCGHRFSNFDMDKSFFLVRALQESKAPIGDVFRTFYKIKSISCKIHTIEKIIQSFESRFLSQKKQEEPEDSQLTSCSSQDTEERSDVESPTESNSKREQIGFNPPMYGWQVGSSSSNRGSNKVVEQSDNLRDSGIAGEPAQLPIQALNQNSTASSPKEAAPAGPTCTLCMERYPNALPLKNGIPVCLHAFCIDCLNTHKTKCEEDGREVTCPNCRKPFDKAAGLFNL